MYYGAAFCLRGAHFVDTISIMNNQTQPPIPFIPEYRRQIFFKIIDEFINIHDIALRMYFLNDHFPPQLLDKALNLLIARRLIGAEFLAWFRSVCKSSDLEMHRILFAELQKENAASLHLVAGKNFKI